MLICLKKIRDEKHNNKGGSINKVRERKDIERKKDKTENKGSHIRKRDREGQEDMEAEL